MRLVTHYVSPVQVGLLRVALSVLPIIAYGAITHSFKKIAFKILVSLFDNVFAGRSCLLLLLCNGVTSPIFWCCRSNERFDPCVFFCTRNVFLNEEKLTFRKVVGLILGLFGIVLLAKPFNADFTPTTWEGTACMVVGS